MRSLHRVAALFLALAAATLAPSDALGQSLAQVRLFGQVSAPSSDQQQRVTAYGHLAEIEIDAATTVPGAAPATLVLHLHVAAGTTGASLAELVASRLKLLGVEAAITGTGDADPGASLWVEGATRVHLRLGGGLGGEVACTEGPPASIQVLPASAIEGPATAVVAASTAIVMKDRRPIRGRASFSTELGDLSNPAETATALWEAAASKWVSDRPGSDSWRPVKMTTGAAITGVSVRLDGPADWGLVVRL